MRLHDRCAAHANSHQICNPVWSHDLAPLIARVFQRHTEPRSIATDRVFPGLRLTWILRIQNFAPLLFTSQSGLPCSAQHWE
jgi:hypothetical protein